MGAPADVIAQFAQEQAADDDFAVWPEAWDALILFLACETQWRYAANGKATGLDYTGVSVVMQMRFGKNGDGLLSPPDQAEVGEKVKLSPFYRVFEGLQIMEKEVLRVWSEQ